MKTPTAKPSSRWNPQKPAPINAPSKQQSPTLPAITTTPQPTPRTISSILLSPSPDPIPLANGPRQTLHYVEPTETCSNQRTIEAAITSPNCDNNNTPADSTDDQFYLDLTGTGSNTSGQWSTTNGQWSGTYGNPATFGPFPIHEESVTLIIIDDENPDCQTIIKVEPPRSEEHTSEL